MNATELVAVGGVVGGIVSQVLNFAIARYKASKQSDTEEKKLELDWQKEFNEATATFRAELQDTIKDLRQEVADLRSDVDRLRKEKMDLEEDVVRLRSKNEEQANEIDKLTRQNVLLESERKKLEARVKELERIQKGG